MDPWYLKNKDTGIFDWHQQIEEVNEFILEKIRDLIENNKIKNILEVACGGGDFTLKYASPDISVNAFEYSAIAVEMAKNKENPCGVNFFAGDALAGPSYKKDFYELVLSKDFLHCITGEDRERFLFNVWGALKDKGLFLLSTHAGLPEKYPEIMKTIDPDTRINHIQTRIYLDRVDIEREFKESNFEILESKNFAKYYTEVFLLKKVVG